MLHQTLSEIPESRRGQGRMYKQADILFFSVLGILSGATSYRKLQTFMQEHFRYLKRRFSLKWKKAPSYSTIRKIIHGVSSKDLEKAFRKQAIKLTESKTKKHQCVGLDGKTLRGSFDNFEDQKAIQVFSAFLTEDNIILAHEEIEGQKTNEIPIAQELIAKLGLKGFIFTGDAMHCQKKLLKS